MQAADEKNTLLTAADIGVLLHQSVETLLSSKQVPSNNGFKIRVEVFCNGVKDAELSGCKADLVQRVVPSGLVPDETLKGSFDAVKRERLQRYDTRVAIYAKLQPLPAQAARDTLASACDALWHPIEQQNAQLGTNLADAIKARVQETFSKSSQNLKANGRVTDAKLTEEHSQLQSQTLRQFDAEAKDIPSPFRQETRSRLVTELQADLPNVLKRNADSRKVVFTRTESKDEQGQVLGIKEGIHRTIVAGFPVEYERLVDRKATTSSTRTVDVQANGDEVPSDWKVQAVKHGEVIREQTCEITKNRDVVKTAAKVEQAGKRLEDNVKTHVVKPPRRRSRSCSGDGILIPGNYRLRPVNSNDGL